MSEWFDPQEPEPHRCRLPEVAGTNKGWRCKCGKAYVRETLPGRDVNIGESPWQWRRSPKHDRQPEQP